MTVLWRARLSVRAAKRPAWLPPSIKISTIVEGNTIDILELINVSQKARYGQSAKRMIFQMVKIDKHDKPQ